MHWWLPNDEGYPPIIRSIRTFVEERTASARDVPTEDLRDMKAIFSSLKLDDSQTDSGPGASKSKGPAAEVAVATDQDWPASNLEQGCMVDMGGMNVGKGDSYGLGFDEGQGFWGGGQDGGAYGIPKPGEFP
jgi:hypothetical protein